VHKRFLKNRVLKKRVGKRREEARSYRSPATVGKSLQVPSNSRVRSGKRHRYTHTHLLRATGTHTHTPLASHRYTRNLALSSSLARSLETAHSLALCACGISDEATWAL